MSLPKTYRLVARHNFGANATVTVRDNGVNQDGNGLPQYGADRTPINGATVPDATDETSVDYDNATDQFAGLNGNLIVSGTNLSGTITLYLQTKTATDYSDSIRSQPLVSIVFNSENGPLKGSYRI